MTLNGHILTNWVHHALPFNQTEKFEHIFKLGTKNEPSTKGALSLFSGAFAIQRNESQMADTFLHLPGWHKVLVL